MRKAFAAASSEALLAPARDVLIAANEKRAAKLRKLEAQRGIAAFAFTGFIVGTLVAYQMTGALFPATAIGIAVGACSAFFITGIKV